MYKVCKTTLSNDVIKQQAAKAGYKEIASFGEMRLAFAKQNRILIVYKNGSVEGGAL